MHAEFNVSQFLSSVAGSNGWWNISKCFSRSKIHSLTTPLVLSATSSLRERSCFEQKVHKYSYLPKLKVDHEVFLLRPSTHRSDLFANLRLRLFLRLPFTTFRISYKSLCGESCGTVSFLGFRNRSVSPPRHARRARREKGLQTPRVMQE